MTPLQPQDGDEQDSPLPPQIEMPTGMQAIRLDSDRMLKDLLAELEETRPTPKRAARSKSLQKSIVMQKKMISSSRLSKSAKSR